MNKIPGNIPEKRIIFILMFPLIFAINSGCVPVNGIKYQGGEQNLVSGDNFSRDARILFRIAACSGDKPIPEQFNREIIDDHCKRLEESIKKYREGYAKPMKEFMTGEQPSGMKQAVIYPFGGGDLLTAITAFPGATEYNTLSLELAGDIQRIHLLKDYLQTHAELKQFRDISANILNFSNIPTSTVNTNENLKATQRGYIPGMIVLALVGLAVHEQEPVSLRYFRFEENGDIHYLDADEIRSVKEDHAIPLAEDWTIPDFSVAFSNFELQFKPSGQNGPIRIYRHIAANLANTHFDQESPVYKYLLRKGHILTMTKGSLYLLWRNEFSNIRDYLINQADFMISDSTGLSPLHLPPGLFEVRTYGRFEGLFDLLDIFKPHNDALLEMFRNQPYRPLPRRFGYPDKANNPHIIILQRRTNE